jgi:hypothetical protein
LYYHDTVNRSIIVVNTVKENKDGLTDRNCDLVKKARKSLTLVRYPSPKDFKNMVCSNMIKNCPVASTDINNAEKMFGPDLATLKVKTDRRILPPVMTDYIKIPQEIIDLNRNVTITIDVMFVNGLPFLISISHKVKFTTVEYISNKMQPNIVKSIKHIISLYNKHGFNILNALRDR